MDIEEIRAKLYEDFDAEGIVERQEKQRAKASKNQPIPTEPVDVYQRTQDRIYETNQKSYPKGSDTIVNIAVKSVIDGDGGEGLSMAYKRAKEDVSALKQMKEKERAKIRRQQYMQEYFLPAVELVIDSATPDDLLSNAKALEELDKYVLLEGSGKGYTASYVRQAYGNQLGQAESRSDASMKSDMQRLNFLLDDGQLRSALGLAQKLKNQIDKGERSASDEDYEVIARVIAYYV